MLTNADRERMFGKFRYVAAPRLGNAERVVITDGWGSHNLTPVSLDVLEHGDLSAPGYAMFHKRVAVAAVQLFEAWRSRDLHKLILTWNGSFAARFRRGQAAKLALSAHAWGSAFDINARWNPMGRKPAQQGEPGSVVELVHVATDLGWIWGGHFTNPDGMHFEAGTGALLGEEP